MRQQKGFTLIELMIVVAVIAVLAAIAIPNYLEQTRKGRRAEASRAIGEYQLAFERWRAENPTYGTCPTGFTCSGSHPTLSRPTSDFYTISESNMIGTTYTLTATPAGRQAGDRCGNLVYIANDSTKPKALWSGEANCNN